MSKYKKKICPNCGKEICSNAFNHHYQACVKGSNNDMCHKQLTPKIREKDVFLSDGEYTCPNCGRKTKDYKSFCHHYGYCINGRHAWNKGLTKETNESMKKVSDSMKKIFSEQGMKEKIRKSVKAFIENNEEYFKEACRKGGLHSVEKQGLRSKNEIHFFNLCKEVLSDIEVLSNAAVFDGWDADVVIPSIKLAILWNGIWHYQAVSKAYSVEQIQARDKVKEAVIHKCGYDIYIVKDMGNENPTFVQKQFLCFVQKFFPKKYKEAEMYAEKYTYKAVEESRQYYLEKRKERLKNSEKMKEYQEKAKNVRIRKRARIINIIHKIRTSSIDFSKIGWVKEASKIIGIRCNKAGFWIKKHMPKFYESQCFKRSVDTSEK